MGIENSKSSEIVAGNTARKTGFVEGMSAGGAFTVTCLDKDNNQKWVGIASNLVVNTGLQDMNTKFFSGSAYTAAWYLGLVTGPGSGTTFAAADTLASHAGWTENTDYSGNRKSVTFGSATTANPSVITNSASPSSFVMTGTATIAGAFLCNAATGTSGVLFSAGDFTGGDKSVASGDTLNVTYTFSLTAT
jgi:hypothetical protein